MERIICRDTKRLRRKWKSPIIHFEVHDSSDKKGLVLTSKELITWEELYQNLAPVNQLLRNELFITMAVCHGSFFLMSSCID